MSLESVGDIAIHMILPKVGPEGTASVACVAKRYRDLASEDCLWSKFCYDQLHLTQPHDPLGNPCPTLKAAYQAWRESFGMYPWPLVRRVKKCWDRLKMWLSNNFPEALATLRKGASEEDINALETSLKVKLPFPTRVLYRFCDGQDLTIVNPNGPMLRSPMGLIGGYSFYDILVNVYLLPLNEIVRETTVIRNQLQFSTRSKYMVVALSSTPTKKIFFFNCTNSQIYVGTQNLVINGEMMPCVPKALISSGNGMLLWLEEHGHRLENGVIKIRNERDLKTINLFPEEGPLCFTAVTNCVKVRASAVFVPEFTDLPDEDESEKYFFSYSIRMSLLPEGCRVDGRSYDSCQLYWRRWIICVNDTVVEDFNAEAVVGQYPLLRPGEREFVYQSCSPQPSTSGSMEGSFTFVPGSLADPKGDPFEVKVPRFTLQLPDYVF